jgi:peptidoglycan-N-acetylglucosamine deacetylase
MFYLVKTPWWLKQLYRGLVWQIRSPRGPVGSRGSAQKVLYLSFDDGPHPVATPFVLDELKKYGAKATFFCIGKNVQEYPQIYRSILMEGHRTGNHTQDHLNGWKVDDKRYLENIRDAARVIDSDLFRPPYGRIGVLQAHLLQSPPLDYKIIMWEVLSADFDRALTGERCARNVIRHARPGSIVVFHDSEKAFDRLREALPKVLEHFSGLGYRFEAIRGRFAGEGN